MLGGKVETIKFVTEKVSYCDGGWDPIYGLDLTIHSSLITTMKSFCLGIQSPLPLPHPPPAGVQPHVGVPVGAFHEGDEGG